MFCRFNGHRIGLIFCPFFITTFTKWANFTFVNIKIIGLTLITPFIFLLIPAKTTNNEVKDELAYCEEIISVIEKESHLVSIPAVKEKLNMLKEVVEDYTEQL